MLIYEAFNTQYAFPVGFVVAFALLVFAFGFQSAKEPPFQELTLLAADERERKPAGKKRKSKEKKPQLNGDVAHGDTSGSDSEKKDTKQASAIKVQEKRKDKPVKEKDDDKKKASRDTPEKRSKGKVNTSIQSEGGRGEPSPAAEKDFFEGDWVQTVSRKERKKNQKNRRLGDRDSEMSSIVKEYLEAENLMSDGASKDPEEVDEKPKDSSEVNVVTEDAGDTCVDCAEIIEQKVSSKESSPLKKKKKKKEKVVKEDVEDKCVNEYPEEPQGIEVVANEEGSVDRLAEPLTETASNSGSPVSKLKKKKDKKKSTEENKEESESVNIKSDVPSVTIEGVGQQSEVDSIRLSAEAVKEASVEGTNIRQPDIDLTCNKENIAFDELGDCSWQEAKTPKKKKKSRRE